MFRGKIFTITSIAFSGYIAGLATERYFWYPNHKKTNDINCDCPEPLNNRYGLECKPALPIFGTVSAAVLLPTKQTEVKNVPPEPPLNASRVSQVAHCAHTQS